MKMLSVKNWTVTCKISWKARNQTTSYDTSNGLFPSNPNIGMTRPKTIHFRKNVRILMTHIVLYV